MMIVMKFLCMLVLGAGLLPAAALRDVRTVYIFPMRNALDQYLASELTQRHLLRVVTDPKAADAVLTDRMGAGFEQTFDQRVLGEKPKTTEERAHSTFGGKGALFLVDKTKQVVWSTIENPKDSSPKQMEKAARRSVQRLKNEMYPTAARPSST